jgi:signal transduction histidine kinase
MKRWLGKLPRLPDNIDRLTVLKIAAILFPVLFIFLLELLRLTVFKETSVAVWSVILLLVVILFSLLFFEYIFTVINRRQKENMRRLYELTTLMEVYQAVDEFHNLNALLNRAMNKLIQITAADFGELYLVDEQSHELVHVLHSGSSENETESETKLQLKEELEGESVRFNQQVIIKNLQNLKDRQIAPLSDVRVKSLAIVPLMSNNDIIGIACLVSSNPDHFKLTESNLLLDIGNRIALAIEKARLYEKVQAVAVLEERERISSELHDGVAQVLSYVITKSQATRQLLRKMAEANDYLEELEKVAQEVYTDTREAILGLRTAVSSDRNMVAALREYVLRFNQMNNIKTELTVGDHIIPSLSPQVELQAIRIIQEALSNIRKHAGHRQQ